MCTRSPELAQVIARLLDGERIEHSQKRLILGVESSVRTRSKFGDGVLASTRYAALAVEAARLLNEIDPRPCALGRRRQ
jgi:hypothetical protein